MNWGFLRKLPLNQNFDLSVLAFKIKFLLINSVKQEKFINLPQFPAYLRKIPLQLPSIKPELLLIDPKVYIENKGERKKITKIHSI